MLSITTSHAAHMLGVHRTTISRLIYRGKLRAARLPGSKARWRIDAASLRALCEHLGVPHERHLTQLNSAGSDEESP